MSPDVTIADGKVVELHFTLSDDGGEVIDSSREGEPMLYLHGAENILPGLEAHLTGRRVGDKLEVVLPPAEAFGEWVPPGPRPVPRDAFPEDIELEPGIGMEIDGPDGEPLPLWVVDIEGDTVLVDANHPLAGVTLHFDVEVLSVRAATAEEAAHGHPHGEHGHEHH